MVVANALSLNMLPADVTSGGIMFRRISLDEARRLVAEAGSVESAIGHKDTAAVVAAELGIQLGAPRPTITLGDEPILVAQYRGPRLPEGATVLPEGARIEYFLVGLAV